MNFKRIVSILLVTVLIASLFVGCSKDSKQSSTSSNGTNQTTAKKGSLMPYDGPEIVYKGYGADLGVKEIEGSEKLNKWNEMRGNVRVEWQTAPFADYDEKIKLFLASGEIPDIIWLRDSPTQISLFGGNGYFLDFNKYIDNMPNLQKLIKKYPNLDYIVTEKGQRFAITDIQPNDVGAEMWYANKTLLDKYNIKVPTNVDEFLEALREVKKADPSVTPLQVMWNLSNLKRWIAMLLDGNSETVVFNEKTGKYEFGPTSEISNRKEIVEFVAKLYEEELIHPEVATLSWEQEQGVIATSKWAFTAQYYNGIEGECYKIKLDEGEKLPIETEMIYIESKSGKKIAPTVYQHDSVPYWGYFANAKVKNPEILASYVDLMISQEASDLYNYGIEGLSYEKDKNGRKNFIGKYVNEKLEGDLFDVRYISLKDNQATNNYHRTYVTDQVEKIQNDLAKGILTPMFTKATPIFGQEEGEERAKLKNALETYIDENETKFIYGKRPLSEWDDYIKELKKIADVDRLIELYNGAKIIKHDGERIYDVIK